MVKQNQIVQQNQSDYSLLLGLIIIFSTKLNNMLSPNKLQRKYCYEIDPEKLLESYDQILTAKPIYNQVSQWRHSSKNTPIRRDQYLDQISKIEKTVRNQFSDQVGQYQNNPQKSQKSSEKDGKNFRFSQNMAGKFIKSNFSKSKVQVINKQYQQNLANSHTKSLCQIQKQSVSNAKVSHFQEILNVKASKPAIKVNSYSKKRHKRLDYQISNERNNPKMLEKQNNIPHKFVTQMYKKERISVNLQRKNQIALTQKQIADQKAWKQQRRKQVMFDSLLSKQMIKIQGQRALKKRKTQGFSKYLFPYY